MYQSIINGRIIKRFTMFKIEPMCVDENQLPLHLKDMSGTSPLLQIRQLANHHSTFDPICSLSVTY